MLPRASPCNAIATGRLVFVYLPGVSAAGFGNLFFSDARIGANPGEALGGHMGHGGHQIIRCNYVQEGFPLFDIARGGLGHAALWAPGNTLRKSLLIFGRSALTVSAWRNYGTSSLA